MPADRPVTDDRQAGLEQARAIEEAAYEATSPDTFGAAADDRQGLLPACPIDGKPALMLSGNCGHSWGHLRAALAVAQVPAQPEYNFDGTVNENGPRHGECGHLWHDHGPSGCDIPRCPCVVVALPAQEEGLDDGETWRDADLIEAVKTGKPLGSMARQRLLELLDRGPSHAS